MPMNKEIFAQTDRFMLRKFNRNDYFNLCGILQDEKNNVRLWERLFRQWSAEDLLEVIKRIDAGESSGIRYSKYDLSPRFEPPEWDYRKYDIKSDNALFKGETDLIREAYESCWWRYFPIHPPVSIQSNRHKKSYPRWVGFFHSPSNQRGSFLIIIKDTSW